MPVDEWCDQTSGCVSPGVNDDPQMNGASVAALKFAVEAAHLLGKTRFQVARDQQQAAHPAWNYDDASWYLQRCASYAEWDRSVSAEHC